jgi:hypothetical protein
LSIQNELIIGDIMNETCLSKKAFIVLYKLMSKAAVANRCVECCDGEVPSTVGTLRRGPLCSLGKAEELPRGGDILAGKKVR